MSKLDEFAVTRRWPAKHPDRIQVYTLDTPNGVKIPIALEEMGLPYEAHRISFADNDQMTPEFLSLNPNNKIPAIIDPAGPDGAPMPLWESGAILLYLADKSKKLIAADAAGRWQTTQWVLFQAAGVGPMFGQVGYFHHFAGKEIEDKRPLMRYVTEARRLLGVLDRRLADREWIVGEYSIADVATFPMIWNMVEYYKAGELLIIDEVANVMRAYRAFIARGAVKRGIAVAGDPDAIAR